jgi:methylenetetrahydrofolate dehydrogenase (NADP+)/methenyltetrahydrofolate cyclohydrolase
MIVLDGKKIKAKISAILKDEIENFKLADKVLPKLVILQVGNNEVSNVYIKQKMSFAQQIGVVAELIKFEEEVSNEKILEKVSELNKDNSVHGMILQLPIPKNLNQAEILNTIDSRKDVDGLGAMNLSKMMRGDNSGVVPATARGIITLLKEYDFEVAGQKIVIVGRSVLVGKSLALALTNLNATVTLCHSQTSDLSKITKTADIIISAVGKPGIVNDECVNEKQIIIDVGISRNEAGVISGDVILEKVRVAALSPVPGGVGQMTVASLFQNLVETYKNQNLL